MNLKYCFNQTHLCQNKLYGKEELKNENEKTTTFISEEAISKEIVAFIGFNMNSTKEERSKAI